MPAASVIVPARNAAATIGRTLAALAEQELGEAYEVIVVDDGSSDDTAERAERAPGDATVITQAALGPGAARNRGVAAAGGPLLAFTDADCFPTRGWLAAGLAALGSADLVQGAVLPDPGAEMGPFDRSVWVRTEGGLYEAASLFLTRDAFEHAGGFEEWLDPRLGKALAEDVWLGWRVRRGGGRSAFCAEALVHHEVFRRRAPGFVADRRRLRYFADLARQVPELRDELFYRRWFLSARTAAFDAALVGAAAAAALRSPLPLALAAPYAARIVRLARPWGSAAGKVGLAHVAADAVGCYSLALGSARRRTPVL